MKNIIHVVPIKSKPETVFEALTTLQGLRGWWTTKVAGEAVREGRITFTFTDNFNPVMKILKMKNEQVEWRCISGARDWIDAIIKFQITRVDEGIKLKFQQSYTRLLDDDTYGIYNHNWGYYLDSLRRYCEEGSGYPYKA